MKAWEIERDRFGLLFSGPSLRTGELIEVVAAGRLIRAHEAINSALGYLSAEDDEQAQRIVRDLRGALDD